MQNVLLIGLVLVLSPGVVQAQADSDHPRKVPGENWPGCKQCGVEGCKGHGLTPNDPGYYGRAAPDRTPVGFWLPIFAGSLLFTIFAILLRRRVRRANAERQKQVSSS